MASSTNRLVFLFPIFILALTGFGSSLRVITEPQSFDENTHELNVTCEADGPAYWARTILSIHIRKEDQDSPILTIDNLQKLTMGPGSKDSMKADGHIDADASKSYLTLSIDNPQIHDAGTYRCRLFFFNEKFKMIKEDVMANVTFQEHEITDIVTILMEKLSNVMSTVQQQGDVISQQNNEIQRLEKQLQDHVMKQNDTIQRLEKNIYDLEESISQQNETIHREHMQNIIKKQVCLAKGWTFYNADQTCLKSFGIDVSSRLTWSKSREACQTFGGDLVQIRDAVKNKFVLDMFDDKRYEVWIGAHNVGEQEFEFKYVDGYPLDTYHPWFPGEPSNKGFKCLFMDIRFRNKDHAGGWLNGYCNAKIPYVCSI